MTPHRHTVKQKHLEGFEIIFPASFAGKGA
jgi:hypothetical protein